MKKLKSLKLMLLGLVALVSTNAFAQTTNATVGIWKVSYTTADPKDGQIVGFKNDVTATEVKNLVIPASLDDTENGNTVKIQSIAADFYNTSAVYTSIETIDMEGATNLTTIGANAFKNCTGLTTVKFGSALTTVGASVFEGCSSLANVSFLAASKAQTIGESAFKGTAIVNLDLTNTKVAAINNLFGTTAVVKNSTLEEVTIPASMTSIVDEAFKNCTKLKTVNFVSAAAAQTIGAGAFSGTAIATLTLTNSKVATLNKLFEDNNTTLTTVSMPVSLTEIAASAFNTCAKLATINFPAGCKLATIGNFAFGTTPSLTKIDFSNCTGGTLSFAVSNTPFIPDGGTNTELALIILPANKVTTINTAFASLPALKALTYDKAATDATTESKLDKVTAIVDGAFAGDAALTSLELPNSVETILGSPFTGCSKLATLTIDATKLTDLGGGTYNLYGATAADLAALTTLTIKGDVTGGAIKAAAFSTCTAITTLKIAEGKSIKTSAMAGGAITVAKNGSITLGTLAFDCGNTTAPIAAGDGTTVTIGAITAALTKEIVSGKVAVSVGAISGVAVGLDALGTTATSLTFNGNIATGATITAYSADNANLTTISLGSIAIVDASTFAAASLQHATALASVTWLPATAVAAFEQTAFDVVANKASGRVSFTTTPEVATLYGFSSDNLYAVKFVADATTPIEVANNGTGSFYYGKFYVAAGSTYKIAKKQDDASVIVYGAYVDQADNATIYMEQLRLINGCYYINGVTGGSAVVVKSTTGDDVSAELTFEDENSLNYTKGGGVVNEINYLNAVTLGTTLMATDPTMDFYAMAKPSKYNMAWKKFSASTSLPVGTFYVKCNKSAGAPELNVVWTDGSEADVTGIENVNAADQQFNGEIFNLQGVRVSAPQKGKIYIQNGKKFMMK